VPNILTRFIDRVVDNKADEYAKRYGINADGSPNKEYGDLIKREVHRRAAMGWWLDLVEPVLWAGLSLIPTAIAAVGTKWATNRDEKITHQIWQTAFITTSINSAVQLLRIPVRYLAGLRGGVESAHVIVVSRTQPGLSRTLSAPVTASSKEWGTRVSEERKKALAVSHSAHTELNS
jgi:hypothetical protein